MTDRFYISPLIRLTLLSFYIALVLPLPILASVTQSSIPPAGLILGSLLGGIVLYGALSEWVETSETGIRVCYPRWMLLRQGWTLDWSAVKALKPRSTGQGGIVYYFVSQTEDRAYLLPMRVAGFTRLVAQVEAKTGINTEDVKPLSQPWMYMILLALTLGLLLVDAWAFWMAGHVA